MTQTSPLSPLICAARRSRRYRRPAMRSMRRAVLRAVVWSSAGQG